MKTLTNVTLYKSKGKYRMEISEDISSYSYSLSLINDTDSQAIFTAVEAATTSLSFDKEGVYILYCKKDDVIDYAVILYLPTFEICRDYMITMITCGKNVCAPRHDCSNCDMLNGKWYRMLSEALIYYDKIKDICDNISLITAEEDYKERIYNLVNKITIITKRCEACIKCEDYEKAIVNVTRRSSGCTKCGGRR